MKKINKSVWLLAIAASSMLAYGASTSKSGGVVLSDDQASAIRGGCYGTSTITCASGSCGSATIYQSGSTDGASDKVSSGTASCAGDSTGNGCSSCYPGTTACL